MVSIFWLPARHALRVSREVPNYRRPNLLSPSVEPPDPNQDLNSLEDLQKIKLQPELSSSSAYEACLPCWAAFVAKYKGLAEAIWEGSSSHVARYLEQCLLRLWSQSPAETELPLHLGSWWQSELNIRLRLIYSLQKKLWQLLQNQLCMVQFWSNDKAVKLKNIEIPDVPTCPWTTIHYVYLSIQVITVWSNVCTSVYSRWTIGIIIWQTSKQKTSMTI